MLLEVVKNDIIDIVSDSMLTFKPFFCIFDMLEKSVIFVVLLYSDHLVHLFQVEV